MKPRWLLLTGFGIYSLALLISAPAALFDGQLQKFSSGSLRLAEADGTLWKGSGKLEIRTADGRTIHRKDLSWRFQAERLLFGNMTWLLDMDQGAQIVPLALFPGGVKIAHINIDLPAAALAHVVPDFAEFGLVGDLTFEGKEIRLTQDSMDGSASLRWRNAGLALSPVSPLGSYEINFVMEGPATTFNLNTLSGPLQVDGEGSWIPGSRPVFLSTAEIPEEFESRLAPFLRLIAVERGPGRFELGYR